MTEIADSTFMPAAECIYCGAAKGLTREHIIPYGLGGDLILENGSFQDCGRITSRFEGRVLRGFMHDARTAGGFPTRRRKQRPTSIIQRLRDQEG